MFGLVVANVTGFTALFRATTGTDPYTGKDLTASERAWSAAEGVLSLLDVVVPVLKGVRFVSGGLKAISSGISAARATNTVSHVVREGRKVESGLNKLSNAEDINQVKYGIKEAEVLKAKRTEKIAAREQISPKITQSQEIEKTSEVLQFSDDPLIDNNILIQAELGNVNAEAFLNANRGLLSYGKVTRYEFLTGSSQKNLTKLTNDFNLTHVDSVNYRQVIAEAKNLRSKFEGTGRVLRLMDSRQLAEAKLLGIDFVTNDAQLYKRAVDLKAAGHLDGINIYYVDLFPLPGGTPSKAATNAANYLPQPVKS